MSSDDKDLREKIKQMEQDKRKPTNDTKELVSFDSWFHLRKDEIPAHHMKEILAADFKARGLDTQATMVQFDRALNLYGIKLN